MLKKITLKYKEERRLNAGHLWVFSNEIHKIEGEPQAGDIVEVAAASGGFLGTGFFNPRSLIAVRMLSREQAGIDVDFWKERIARALEFRRRVYPGLASFRAVYGESDGLPGLVVDKYDSCLAVQFLSAGMDRARDQIVEALTAVFNPAGIVARNDSALRALEGLPSGTELLAGAVPDRIVIDEYGCRFAVDLMAGQKTGFFFDQRDNRRFFGPWCAGKRVLDGFCHTGGFGIHAARAGAARVVLMDSSKPALAVAEENARLNDAADRCETRAADVMEYLESSAGAADKFDIINIDPPGLIKSKKFFQPGYKIYRKLNTAALRLLGPGGILATSSCSHHLAPADFRSMLEESAGRSGRQVRLLELRSQSKDHPVLLSMPETEYLKFALLQVI